MLESPSECYPSAWSPDGKFLVFMINDPQTQYDLWLMPMSGERKPQLLFEIEGVNYAPSKDGQRFLVPVVTEGAPAPPINVVLNWTAEVKRQ